MKSERHGNPVIKNSSPSPKKKKNKKNKRKRKKKLILQCKTRQFKKKPACKKPLKPLTEHLS